MGRDLLSENLNTLWASLIVDALVKNGLDTFFISPGNRNAPLISALAHNDHALKKLVIDERGAAFRAVGHARATGRPGVLVCTSGTAPANYYPALIEADRDAVPLLILSADRPPELVGSDANQTIRQPGLYAHFCRETLYLPCPCEDFAPQAILAKIDHALNAQAGPVHINCPFRDPLTPGEPDRRPASPDYLKACRTLFDRGEPYTSYPEIPPAAEVNAAVLKILLDAQNGLLVIGRLDSPLDPDAAEILARRLGWPVYCDIASGLKTRVAADAQIFTLDHPAMVRMLLDHAPDTVLQLGAGLVSKAYYQEILPGLEARIVQVSPRQGHRDPSHRVTHRLRMPVHRFAEGLCSHLDEERSTAAGLRWLSQAADLQASLSRIIPRDMLSYPRIAELILADIPAGEALFLGNSLAIRAFDNIRPPVRKPLALVSNRGVSGIEGNIATSVGFAEGSGRRVTAVIGDISLMHDLNSLLMLGPSTVPVLLVVVNNRGGRIFERLPIQRFPEIMEPFMTTPHQMDFEYLARQFSIPYVAADTPESLTKGYASLLRMPGSAMMEVFLDPGADLDVFRQFRHSSSR